MRPAHQIQLKLNGRAYRFPPVAPSRLTYSFNVFREPASRLQFAVVQRPVASLIFLPAHHEQLPAVDAQSTTGLSSDAQNLTDGSSGQFAGNANGHS